MADTYTTLTNLRGPAARITSAVAETLPSGEPASVVMSGPDQNRQFTFRLPAGLPGVNAVPTAEAMADYATTPASPFYGTLRDLTRHRTGMVSAADFGVVMDGETDDTAAWQNLVDSVPRGTTIMLPPSDSGAAWSVISDTIVITTDSLRIVGPSSYEYNGGFVFTGTGKPMFQVKAAGVQFEYFSIVGRSAFGADSTYGWQVGIDYYGSVAGDMDGRVTQCSFLNLGTAIITHGRNLTVEQTLFGALAIAWEQLAKTPSYHDMGQPNIIRGNIVRDCRFHAVGVAGSSPSISIHDHTDYRHGVIQDSYWDNNCMGVAVQAVGVSGTPIRGLMISGNTVQEATAGFVYLEYCDSPFIGNNLFTGTGSALYTFDAITAVNCPSLVIVGCALSRIGRHGILLTGCSDVEILSTRMALVGVAATGDAVNVDATSVRVWIDGLSVAGGTGYGINGSPTVSGLGQVRLRTTAGPLNSTTLAMPSRGLSGAALTPTIGSPTPGVNNNYPVMLLDPDTSEGVGGFLEPPEGATLVAVEVVICTTTAASGTVRIQLSRMIPSATMTDQVANTTISIPVSGAGGVFRGQAHATTPATLGPIGVRAVRIATDSNDTYPADIGIVALNLVQTQ